MKRYSAESIYNGRLIVYLEGVGRYEILRVTAELFKADVPACIVPIPRENKRQCLSNMLLLSDRFGEDIIIGAEIDSSKKEIREARKNGAKMVVLKRAEEKIIKYAKKLGLIVLSEETNPSLAAISVSAGADIIAVTEKVEDFLSPSVTDRLFVSVKDEKEIAALKEKGHFGYILSSPIVTEELLKEKNYPPMKEKADEILKLINE